MAATLDPELKNIGRKIGLEIWRMNKLKLEKLPAEQHGNFYNGDSYLVLSTKGVDIWNVHIWLGNETSTDEKGAVAIKMVELDQALGGIPVQYREVEEHESALFLSYFKDGIRYLKGGVSSGFRHVKENKYEDWKSRLFHCKGKRNVRCVQVDCNLKSLNLGDVFILDCGLDIYVWMPPKSGRLERIKGMAQAKNIRDQERSGKPKLHGLDQDWDSNHRFWKAIGGKPQEVKSAEEGGLDENFWRIDHQTITLWRVCDDGGTMDVKLVCAGAFNKSQLDTKDAFILDAGRGGLYIWIGKQCTVDERKRAMEWATSHLRKMNKPEWTPVSRVLEGAEPDSFTQWANEWHDNKNKSTFVPKLFQCSDESGHLAVDEIADFTQEDLDGDDVMILDAKSIIYVWIGANANLNEKMHAKDTAKQYLQTDNIPRNSAASFELLYQGAETPSFKKLFKSWDDKMFTTDARSYANMRKLMFS